jgi:hypothetical protein
MVPSPTKATFILIAELLSKHFAPPPLYPLPPREGRDLERCKLQLFYNPSRGKTEPVIEVCGAP